MEDSTRRHLESTPSRWLFSLSPHFSSGQVRLAHSAFHLGVIGAGTSPSGHGNHRTKRRMARRTVEQAKQGFYVAEDRLSGAVTTLVAHHATSPGESRQLHQMTQNKGTCGRYKRNLFGVAFSGPCPSCGWMNSKMRQHHRTQRQQHPVGGILVRRSKVNK